MKTIIETLDYPITEIEENRTNKDDSIGFPRKYLEEKTINLARDGKHNTFMDVVSLFIYGVVLFPNIKGITQYIQF